MDVNSPVYLQHACLRAFHRTLGDDINQKNMPPTSPAYGWCSAIIFNKPSSRDATAVCGTVCKPPRQAYVILLDVDCGGSDLIVDRPKAPTKTNYIHHAPFSFHSHSGIRWGESATLKLSESLFDPLGKGLARNYSLPPTPRFLRNSTIAHIIFLSFEGWIPHLRRHRRSETSR